MGHCYHHALSSARKWGGTADDYLTIHQWFDEPSKLITADFRHRVLRHHAEGIFMLVIWTGKPATMEVVVPVVHRRGPAARVARISAQAERAAGRCLWTHRGEHRAACPISRFLAYWNQRPRPTRSASVWISAAGGEPTFAPDFCAS